VKIVKIVCVVLIGMIFFPGCALKSAVTGRSVCKPGIFESKKITIDCDSIDLKAALTKYFMAGDWNVFEGPNFKTAQYIFDEGYSSAMANTNVSANLVFGGKSDSARSRASSRKITTTGEYDLKSDYLLKVELSGDDIFIKIFDYKTQEIFLSCSLPYDNYFYDYFTFCINLHRNENIKDISITSIDIVSSNKYVYLSGITAYIDGKREQYTFDSKTRSFKSEDILLH